MPMDYQHASEDFERFLAHVIARAGLTTRNQAFTTVEGVLLTFRRRLSARDGLRFADVLPPVLRAIFVADWDIEAPRPAFGARADWTREAQSLRKDHNFSSEGVIAEVAAALRQSIAPERFEAALADLPEQARAFWSVAP
ncbi:DUF2267 domain-containing protein [Rhodoblastus sphagnicola]|nr:DUF2267 domain-containing protein [Rhodoblastus sphagnicola]